MICKDYVMICLSILYKTSLHVIYKSMSINITCITFNALFSQVPREFLEKREGAAGEKLME